MKNFSNFFRIILQFILKNGTLESFLPLELPRSFIKEYGKRLSKYAILKVPTGAEYRMELKMRDGRAWLRQGWPEFVEKYSIKCGYFLVFRYEARRSLFNVMIFDLSTWEIDYPRTTSRHFQKQLLQVKEEDSDADDDCPQKVPKGRKMNNASKSRKVRTGRHVSCIENSSLGKDHQVPERKQLGTTQSPNLHFTSMMQPSNNKYLNVPAGPTRSRLLEEGNSSIILRGVDGRTWSFKYTIGSPARPQVTFSSGWAKFWGDNHLQEGDVCAFDLVKSKPLTFKVTISRITEEAGIGRNETLMLTDNAKDRVLKRVESFKTKNPHFVIRMTPYYLSPKPQVHIPTAHSRRYLKEDGENVIILHGSNGRTWPVQHRIKNKASMTKTRVIVNGWKDFAKDNRLRVGDSCIFEKMIGKAKAYKVTIFQIVDHA